ncbi:PilZ domain-containing protein [Methylobacterium sp. E-025]|uniref:PilZ domain-containing protein n=1 Tax=Methylobacterium sp. E-025 TaxID=2836561 RepID=UPI00391888AD
MSGEQRSSVRKTLFRIGEMQLDDCSYVIDCLVRDSSEIGALIEVGHTNGLPDQFRLTIPSNGLNRRCRVVRRTAHMLGVAFTG